METKVTESNIAEVLASSKVVAIDFWATWCGPCRMLAPVVEEIANEFEGKAVIGKCDVDESQELAMQYGIRNIPTILFFKDGQVVDKTVGGVPKSEIVNKLNVLL